MPRWWLTFFLIRSWLKLSHLFIPLVDDLIISVSVVVYKKSRRLGGGIWDSGSCASPTTHGIWAIPTTDIYVTPYAFPYFTFCGPYHSHVRYGGRYDLSLFYNWGQWSWQKLNYLSNVTQAESGLGSSNNLVVSHHIILTFQWKSLALGSKYSCFGNLRLHFKK